MARSLVELAGETARSHGAERVLSLRLRIGALTGITIPALRFTFAIASEGTCCAGATLVVERVPLTVHCPACAAPKILGSPVRFRCPDCGGHTPDMVAGRELEIVSVDLEGGRAEGTEAQRH